MIEYKAGLYGIEVVKVSEAYSSQTCHGCGEVRKTNRPSEFILVRLRMADTRRCNGAANLFPSGIQGISSSGSDGVVGMWRPPWSCPTDWVGIRRHLERFEPSEMPPNEFGGGRPGKDDTKQL
jgi:hypothetical protein